MCSHSLRRARFAKYRFSNLQILHFRCFIPCFRVIARRKRTVVTLDMFISVQVYSFCFVSFRFAKYSNSRLKMGQNTLTWSSSLSIIWVSSKSGSSIDTSSKTESSENDCNWVVGDWVVKLLTDSSTMLTNCTFSLPCECYVHARQ